VDQLNQLRAFQESTNKGALLLSTIKSSGVGLNVIEATSIIFLHEDWNPQVTQQAIGHAVCLGLYQFSFYIIYNIFNRSTQCSPCIHIEQLIQIQEKKHDLQIAFDRAV
jgi:hypothetical protein